MILNSVNSMPCAHVLVQHRGGTEYGPLKVSIDMASQNFYMSSSEFVRIHGTDKLPQVCNQREEVHETISYETEGVQILTVIAEYPCLIKMQVGTGETTTVRVTRGVYENHNSQHCGFVPATVPRQFFASYSKELEEARDTGHISTAFFAEPPACGFQEVALVGSYRSSGGSGGWQNVASTSRNSQGRQQNNADNPVSRISALRAQSRLPDNAGAFSSQTTLPQYFVPSEATSGTSAAMADLIFGEMHASSSVESGTRDNQRASTSEHHSQLDDGYPSENEGRGLRSLRREQAQPAPVTGSSASQSLRPSSLGAATGQAEDEDLCIFCFGTQEYAEPLVRPCSCKTLMHPRCWKRWTEKRFIREPPDVPR